MPASLEGSWAYRPGAAGGRILRCWLPLGMGLPPLVWDRTTCTLSDESPEESPLESPDPSPDESPAEPSDTLPDESPDEPSDTLPEPPEVSVEPPEVLVEPGSTFTVSDEPSL